MSKENDEVQSNGSTYPFVQEVGKYFLEFLETDFHKRKLPRRSIKLHNERGLLTGFNISKYPSFYKAVYKLINDNLNNTRVNIQKGTYKADIPAPLLDLINKQIKNVNDSDITLVVKEIEEAIKQASSTMQEDYLQAYNSTIENTNLIFKTKIVSTLVGAIQTSLQNNKLADENAIFQMEEELTGILTKKTEEVIAECLKALISGNKVSTKKLLKDVLDLEDVRLSFTKYFEMFKVSDLFNDIHELYQNYKLEEKQEFYFYFYDISYQKNKYPIFYIPFSLERISDTFDVVFDSQIYINKKALAFIVQEYNVERQMTGDLKTISDRILYLADHETDLAVTLQDTLTEITNFFSLEEKILVAKPDIQTSKSLYVAISTNIYVSLFDKSDEALLNDYEDILNAPEDSTLMSGFQTLIDNFIHKNPESVARPIRDEWDNKGVDERLVYKSPIPLNSEQLQIIQAINKENCKYVLVEGPPGTGKSHTITAIVFETILNNKSVLVLSDKKEALDVVEKNIENTLNKVRVGDDFLNPVLRLGKTGNNYARLLAQSSIDAITQQFRVVRSQYPNLGEQIDSAIHNLRGGVSEQIKAYQEISLDEINELAGLHKHFSETGFHIDIDEAIGNSESSEELQHIRTILLDLKDRVSENREVSFNFDYSNNLEEKTSDNLEEIISLLEDIDRLIEEKPDLFEVYEPTSVYNFVTKNKTNVTKLVSLLPDISNVSDIISKHEWYVSLISGEKETTFDNLEALKAVAEHAIWLQKVLVKVKHFAKDNLQFLNTFNTLSVDDVQFIRNYIVEAKKIKSPVFGYIGKKGTVETLNSEFRKRFIIQNFEDPHKHIHSLESIVSICDYILELQNSEDQVSDIDSIELVCNILRDEKSFYTSDELKKVSSNLGLLESVNKLANEIGGDGFSILTFNDLYSLATTHEILALYEELRDLIEEEKELIETNINIAKGDGLESLLADDNIQTLIKEFVVCKKYIDTLIEVSEDLQYLKETSQTHRASFKSLGISENKFSTLYENGLTTISDLEFQKLLRLIQLNQKLTQNFNEVTDLSYGDRMKQIENIVTMQMTYRMDERFVDFTNDFKADAKALKKVISDKRKFPKEQFSKLRNAFPCILAGIRDYAEYIPLEPEIFDLVIIDEASQVSIAQALPALLRAKKVVVLGDNRQFSNVKSALARGDVNKQYLASLSDVFKRTVSTDTDKVARLEKFNIKVSILDFFGFINNYQTRLVKHFRGYPELISYSNKFFYEGGLQVMKVRGIPISSVIKFTQIEHDGKQELEKNTNVPEAEFIISELIKLKEENKVLTVGIITPHTNQQRLIFEMISDNQNAEYFFDKLKLKVMTFDTCQGEEMDTIFYSMVATSQDDKLNYIFTTSLNNIDLDDDEGKIKAQRLNVGLSRAKECMHFVLSKPVEEYTGTVKEFLRHYENALNDALKEPDANSVDKNSKMEPLVLEWIKQTQFWEENRNNAEIKPQFELGKYLKQLDRSYNHPNYRVDFLLVYTNEEGKDHKIIIEYDGFLEHFGEFAHVVNSQNYERYYSAEDVYRQHVLEGYGYRFIRINKFNLGENPIATLDSRIQELVKKNSSTMK